MWDIRLRRLGAADWTLEIGKRTEIGERINEKMEIGERSNEKKMEIGERRAGGVDERSTKDEKKSNETEG